MGWLGDLLKPGSKPKRSIVEIERALSRLGSKRAEAREAVTALMARREQLLLEDDSDAKIAKCDSDADKHRLTIERCKLAQPLLVAELEAARSEARRKRWRDLRSQYDIAARAYAGTLRAAAEKQAEMIALGDTARREGYEQEAVATFTPPARLVSNDSLADYELALDRQRDAIAAQEATPATPPPAIPAKAAPPRLAAVPRSAAPAPKPPPRSPVKETAGEGETAVVVIRSGLEAKGQRWIVGDQIALPSAEAEAMLRAGAVPLADGQRLTWGAA